MYLPMSHLLPTENGTIMAFGTENERHRYCIHKLCKLAKSMARRAKNHV